MRDAEPKTLSVVEAGKRYFGLGRCSSYAAAQRGDLPIIRIGKLIRVPVAAMERMMTDAGTKPVTVEPEKTAKKAAKAALTGTPK